MTLSTSTDQATQVSFPVLLRSQQRALKRFATLGDLHGSARPPNIWTATAAVTSLSHHHKHRGGMQDPVLPYRDREVPRPRSLYLSPLDLLSPPTSANGTITPTPSGSGSRSRLGTFTTPGGSYDGSDQSLYDVPRVVYTGQFKAVHQSKWKIGSLENHQNNNYPHQQDSLSTSKSMCSCGVHGTGAAVRYSTTPEGLSWRRLHMSRAKLKATATTSELLSGFAMVAMVELQINEPTTVPEWLFVLFAVCTTILVAVHIFALMISTYILPNIDAISKLDVSELVTESPHERMRGFIELAWAFSTVLGLFLFLVEIAILCWVKFWDYSFTAAIAATVIVIPVLVVFVAFAVHFYHSLVAHKCDASTNDIQQLEDMKRSLDQAISPV